MALRRARLPRRLAVSRLSTLRAGSSTLRRLPLLAVVVLEASFLRRLSRQRFELCVDACPVAVVAQPLLLAEWPLKFLRLAVCLRLVLRLKLRREWLLPPLRLWPRLLKKL